MAATKPHPIRLSENLRGEIAETAAAVRLSFPETARQAMHLGLPLLKKKLKKK
jgi:hypothetical protein